jgi:transposase
MKKPDKIHIDENEIESLIERLESNTLSTSDKGVLVAIVQAYFWIQSSLFEARMSIKRLKSLFGLRRSEKRKNLGCCADEEVLQDMQGEPSEKDAPDLSMTPNANLLDLSPFAPPMNPDEDPEGKQPIKGHGRISHEAYVGATTQEYSHESLKKGDPCPEACGGRLYNLKPSVFVCLKGHPLVSAKKHILERLRCNLCNKIFTSSPPNLRLVKYNETVKAQVVISKFYMGVPYYRLESWQDMVGVPLRDATQYELTVSVYEDIYPVYLVLEQLAAQGNVLYHDDTKVRILSLMLVNKMKDPGERTGMFTTAVVSKWESRTICLFYSGSRHSGENMQKLMEKRSPGLPPFIRMCDALSSNLSVAFEEILSVCLVHGRRNFYEIYDYFPGECGCVIDALAIVYHNDEVTKKEGMSPEMRLSYHQEHSAPLLETLKAWMVQKIKGKETEPNGSLGKAFRYMLRHWDKLTQFLRVPNCPLDNNIAERTLKIAIRSRKNSLFYKTEESAAEGGVLTSMVHTAAVNGENPFDYLVAIQQYSAHAKKSPESWLPWNYRETMEGLRQERAPPLAA